MERLEERTLLSIETAQVSQVVGAAAASADVAENTATPTLLTDWTGSFDGSGLAAPYGGSTPNQIRGAYGLGTYSSGVLSGAITFKNASGVSINGDGSGQTIAIVDAYDDPNAATDLNTFSTYYGLPTFGGTGQPTFTKLNETGGTTLPGTDTNGPWSTTGKSDWEQEESLDIEWAHVVAPMANIILYEATTASGADLDTAVGTAAQKSGVVAISMSWGGGESSGETTTDSTYFVTPSGHVGGAASVGGTGLAGGVTFLASSGDSGAYASGSTTITPQYPATSPNVVAVGGTTLNVSGNNWSSETTWGNGTSSGTSGGAGGGISAYETQPTYQSGTGKVGTAYSTTKRVYPDVSAEANPSTGVPIYDSWDFGSSTPWVPGIEGGTSLSCPIWAGMVSLIDQGRAIGGLGSLDGKSQTLPQLYQILASTSTDLHDITSGSAIGPTTTPSYGPATGYDLASGMGSLVGNKLIPDMVGPNASALTVTPSVTNTAPAIGATATSYGGSTIAAAEYFIDSVGANGAGTALSGSFTSATVSVSGTLSAAFSGLSQGTHTLYVHGENSAGVWGPMISVTFTKDTVAPTISIGSPSATLTRGGPITYTVTYADLNFNASTLAAANITLNKTGTATGSLAITGTGLTRSVTISGITGDGSLGISIVAGTASDLAGNLAPAAGPSATVTVDNTPPTITPARISVSGASGSGGVFKVGDMVTATWNNTATGDNNSDVASVTVDFSQFGGGAAVVATNSANTWTASYTIVAGSIAATNCNAVVTAVDNAGNSNTKAGSSNVAVDDQPPTVQSFSPSSGAVNVATGTSLGLLFSESVKQGTSGNIVIERAGDNTVVATIPATSSQIVVSGAQVTIATGTTLAFNTAYYVLIDSGTFLDLPGNAYAGITSPSAWTFTTGTPDLTVAMSHPGNFAQGDFGDTYSVTVTNSGTDVTRGSVSLADVLPAGLTATAISGVGWTVNLATLTASRSDALAAGASYPVLTVTVNVVGNAPSGGTNVVTVSGGGELNTANDTANDPTTVVQRPHTVDLQWSGPGGAVTLTETTPGSTPAVTLSEPANLSVLEIDLGPGYFFDASSVAAATGLSYLVAGVPTASRSVTIDLSQAGDVGLLQANLAGDGLTLSMAHDPAGGLGGIAASAGTIDVTGLDTSAAGANVDLRATGNLTVDAGATLQSGLGTISLEADVNADGTGDDGGGTLSIAAGATVASTNPTAAAITLRGAAINIDTTNAATVVAATVGGVVVRSSLASLPMSLGGTDTAVAGINLTDGELAQIVTASTGTVTFGDATQTGNITFTTAQPATAAGAATVAVQAAAGPGQIILDDGAGMATALDGNGGSITLDAGAGGIVAASADEAAADIATTGATVTLNSAGPIGSSSNPLQFANNANSGEQNVMVDAASDIDLGGLGSLTLGTIATNGSMLDASAAGSVLLTGSLTTGGGTVSLQGNGITQLSAATLDAGPGTVTLDAGNGAVAMSSVAAAFLGITANGSANITGQIGTLLSVQVGGDFHLTSSAATGLTVTGPVAIVGAGNIVLASWTDLAVDGPIVGGSGIVDLIAGEPLSDPSVPVGNGGALTINSLVYGDNLIDLIAWNLAIGANGTVNAGSLGTVAISGVRNSETIGVGTAPGDVTVDNTELGQITAQSIVFGNPLTQTGNITFQAASLAGFQTVIAQQSPTASAAIVLDDSSGTATALDAGGGNIQLAAGTGGILAANPNDSAAEIATTGPTVTLATTGPIGSAANRIQFADNANAAQQNVVIGQAGSALQPAGVFLDGLGSLTLGSIQGGTVNAPIDVTARSNLLVAPDATIDSGAATLSLGADLNPDGTGDDGVGTLSIGAGATVVSANSNANAITLRGADIDIDTSANPALVGARFDAASASVIPTAGGVVLLASLPWLPMSFGGTNNAVGGINLTDAELARIQTTAAGEVTIGDAAQTGDITFTSATVATTPGASTVVVQAANGPGEIVLDDAGGVGLDGNGAAVSLSPGGGGIVALASPGGVPLVSNSFQAVGPALTPILNYAPSPGSQITLLRNTADSPMAGTFANLPPDGVISATYNGQTYYFRVNYGGGSGGDLTLTTMFTTTTSLVSDDNPSVYGDTVQYTATLTGNGATPTGTVQFQINGANVGAPVNLVGGSATYTASSFAVGNYSIGVVYAVQSIFLDSASAAFTQMVGKATPAITASDAGGIYCDSPYGGTAAVAGVVAGVDVTPAASLEGVAATVAYYVGNTASGPASSTPPTAAGTYTIVASFPGSTSYAAVRSPTVFTIAKATPTCIFFGPVSGTFNGLPHPLIVVLAGVVPGVDATLAASLEGVKPILTYYPGDAPSGMGSSSVPTAAGTYTVVVSFPGSADYASMPNRWLTFTIGRAMPTITASNAGGTFDGSSYPTTASVAGMSAGIDTMPASSLETVPLTVTYYSGGTVNGTGSATAPTAPGTYTSVASFAGSNDYLPAQSTPLTFAILSIPSATLASETIGTGQPGFWSSAASTWKTGQGLDGGTLTSSTANGSKQSQAAWWFSMPAGVYEIDMTWPAAANLTTKLGLDLYDGVGNWIGQIPVNEQVAPSDFSDQGVEWKRLGCVDLTNNIFHISTWNSATDGAIAIGAIRLRAVATVNDGDVQLKGRAGSLFGSYFTTAGSWTPSSQGAFGGSETSTGTAGSGRSIATWNMPVAPGAYEVDATWAADASLSANVTYNVYDGSTLLGSVNVNQQAAPSGVTDGGIAWQSLGDFTVSGNQLTVTVANAAADGQVCADAIRILPASQPTEIIANTYPGSWLSATGWTASSQGLFGQALVSNTANGSKASQAAWWFAVQPGQYEVDVTWQADPSYSQNVGFDVYNGLKWIETAAVNEQNAPVGVTDQGVVWQSLGVFTMTSDMLHVSLWNSQSDGAICIDGVRIVPVGTSAANDETSASAAMAVAAPVAAASPLAVPPAASTPLASGGSYVDAALAATGQFTLTAGVALSASSRNANVALSATALPTLESKLVDQIDLPSIADSQAGLLGLDLNASLDLLMSDQLGVGVRCQL